MDDFYPVVSSVLNGQLEVINVLGKGTFGIILLCLDLNSKQQVVVKRFFPDKMFKKLEENIIEETRLPIKSEFLVKGESYFVEDGFLHLVMQYVEGTPLNEVLISRCIEEIYAAYLALCITKAASVLQAAHILSTDIKPENIIITPLGKAILIDLNCFERVHHPPRLSEGTWPYSPKELVAHEVLSYSTDIYSIGMTYLEMLIGSEEFTLITDLHELDLRREIKLDISFLHKKYPKSAPIIDKSIEPRPDRRYQSADELYIDLLSLYNSLKPVKKEKVLTLIYGQNMELQIKKGRIKIGRNHLDPSFEYVSQKHFEIDFDGANARICDLKSRNGTKVNDVEIKGCWVSLKDTDVITAADIPITVRLAECL